MCSPFTHRHVGEQCRDKSLSFLLHECTKIDPGVAFYKGIETLSTMETRHQLSNCKDSQTFCCIVSISWLR